MKSEMKSSTLSDCGTRDPKFDKLPVGWGPRTYREGMEWTPPVSDGKEVG